MRLPSGRDALLDLADGPGDDATGGSTPWAMASRTWSLARYGSAWLKSKCSNSSPGSVTFVVLGTWLAVWTMERFTVDGLKMLISLFWRAGTSWLSSEKNWKTSLFSLPGVPQ